MLASAVLVIVTDSCVVLTRTRLLLAFWQETRSWLDNAYELKGRLLRMIDDLAAGLGVEQNRV